MIRRDLLLLCTSFTSALAATQLVGYEGCDDGGKTKIDEAYTHAKKIFDVVRGTDIKWNTILAGDFLGPPKWNQGFEPVIQAIIQSVANLNGGTPSKPYSINVRCDDWRQKCKGSVSAYAVQENKQYKTGSINFCTHWFQQLSLDEVVEAGKRNENWNYKYNMENYQNARAVILIHELLHVDWVVGADPYGSHESVIDYNIQFYDEADSHRKVTRTVYGARLAKILAKWFDSSQTKPSIGRIIASSDESLALYMLAMYLEQQLGTYPHLPEIKGSPPLGKPLPSTPNLDDPFSFNITGGIVSNNQFNTNSNGYPSPDYSPNEKPLVDIVIDKFIDIEDYPKEYQDAYKKRVDPLMSGSNFHNQLHDGWISVRSGLVGSDVGMQDIWSKANDGYTTVSDGFVNYWSPSCQGLASYMWPMEYGDVYLKSDGYMHDSQDNRIGTIKIDC